MPELHPIGRALILLGIALMVIGGAVLLLPKVPWGGRLPGDILLQRDHVTFYFPLATCLLLSALLTVVLWLVSRFR